MSKDPAPFPTHTPSFRFPNLGKLDSARLRWSARKYFNRDISKWRMPGSARATRPLDANAMDLRSLCAYWKFHTFTAIDLCNLA